MNLLSLLLLLSLAPAPLSAFAHSRSSPRSIAARDAITTQACTLYLDLSKIPKDAIVVYYTTPSGCATCDHGEILSKCLDDKSQNRDVSVFCYKKQAMEAK